LNHTIAKEEDEEIKQELRNRKKELVLAMTAL